MKKLLVLMLVLGLVVYSVSAVSIEIRDSGGSAVSDLNVGSSYTLYVVGDASEAPIDGGIYGPSWTASDWDALNPSGETVLDTGDMSTIDWFDDGTYQGYEWTAADSGTGGEGVSTGDWFSIDLAPDAEATYDLGVFDYGESASTSVQDISGSVVPEPLTIGLLGLGGLFVRRRKA